MRNVRSRYFQTWLMCLTPGERSVFSFSDDDYCAIHFSHVTLASVAVIVL